jgi:hypothetical protein
MPQVARIEKHISQREAPREKLNRRIVDGFLECVPVGEDLFLAREKGDEAFRASSFLDILKSLDEILDHFDELTKEEQKSILARTDSVILEAHRWSHISSNRDIQRELERKIAQARMIERSRPKLKIVREKYRA